MRVSFFICVVIVALVSNWAMPVQASEETAKRRFSALAGMNGEFGGHSGIALEIHTNSRNWSLLAGVGMTSLSEPLDAERFVSWGLSGRRYFLQGKTRAHVQVTYGLSSYAVHRISYPDGTFKFDSVEKNYGVIVGPGYEIQSSSGFTGTLTWNFAWEPGRGFTDSFPSLGLGYSW